MANATQATERKVKNGQEILRNQLSYSPLFSRDLNFAKIFSAHFASL